MTLKDKKSTSSPRDAGSLILLRKSKAGPQVLMGRRPPQQIFMPDVFVFPGGAVERTDGMVESTSNYHPVVEEILKRHSTLYRARGIGLAAIRETFEETGLLVGKKGESFVNSPPEGWSAFAQNQIKPRLDILRLIARAITPKGPPRRYHARFFVADARYAHGSAKSSRELLDLDWYPLTNIFDTLPMAQVTELVLSELIGALARKSNNTTNHSIPIFSRRQGKRMIRFETATGSILQGLFETY